MHGDADLYVSRTNKFPTGSDEKEDKRSSKPKGTVDQLTFEQADNYDLKGDYYIGVKGHQSSIFEILVRPEFEGDSVWS